MYYLQAGWAIKNVTMWVTGDVNCASVNLASNDFLPGNNSLAYLSLWDGNCFLNYAWYPEACMRVHALQGVQKVMDGKGLSDSLTCKALWADLKELKSTLKELQSTYSETCLERPLPWETTWLQRPHIFGRRANISVQLNLSPEITCLERPHFCGQRGGLSRQVLLYFVFFWCHRFLLSIHTLRLFIHCYGRIVYINRLPLHNFGVILVFACGL